MSLFESHPQKFFPQKLPLIQYNVHAVILTTISPIQFISEAFQSRTRETHANQCASLSGPLKDHFATTYGLHRDSILNTSRYFHVTEGLVPDIMHDVLEGCLAYEVKELLKHLISTSIITLSELQRIMASFPYTGSDSRNKPTPLSSTTLSSSDHNLKQTGEYVHLLCRSTLSWYGGVGPLQTNIHVHLHVPTCTTNN